MGRKAGRAAGELRQTTDLSDRLVRLPLWLNLEDQQADVIGAVREATAQ
jgi:dTDP-4-amino-4,6-dideoxygalactose transaminase